MRSLKTEKSKKNKSGAVANAFSQKKSGNQSTFQFVDNRSEVVNQRKSHDMANNNLEVQRMCSFQAIANQKSQSTDPGTKPVVQLMHNRMFGELSDALSSATPEQPNLTKNTSVDLAARSIRENRGAAYIINTIMPYTELEGLKNIIQAMIDGLNLEDLKRVAIVIGVNAREDLQKDLENAIQRTDHIINAFGFPIALVPDTFIGRFPHGTMRNRVMQSVETRRLTEIFTHAHLHSYLSFQDSDSSSRRVGSDSGPHIFHVVDSLLAGGPPAMGEEAQPIRPLSIAGGYRPQDPATLRRMTVVRLEKEPISGVSAADVQEKLVDFEAGISRDMSTRDMLARATPLLPYAPEPNLFVDATAAYRPSPSGTSLEFGPHGAEYAHLSRTLAQYNADELEAYYHPLYEEAPEEVDFTPCRNVDQQLPRTKGEIKGQLSVDSQLNRHPIRGVSYHTDFSGMAVATDLSRLAHGSLKSGRGLQEHDLSFIATSLFADRSSKRGLELGHMRDQFRDREEDPLGLKFAGTFVVREGMESSRDDFYRKNITKLGGLKRQRPNPALSGPFSASGPFAGMEYGVPKEQFPAFAYHAALAAEMERLRTEEYFAALCAMHRKEMADQALVLAAHIDNLKANAFPLEETGVNLGMSHWTEPDGDCAISALSYISGRPLTRKVLAENLRQKQMSSPEKEAAIESLEAGRWLQNDEIMVIANAIGIGEQLAIAVNYDARWMVANGDPATAQFIIGGVPAAANGGFPNHWVVLERR